MKKFKEYFNNKLDEKFKHRDKYAFGEVRSYQDFKDLSKQDLARLPDYYLLDTKDWKIIAGYQSMNVPGEVNKEYSSSGKDYHLVSAYNMRNPQSYSDNPKIDYNDKKSWKN